MCVCVCVCVCECECECECILKERTLRQVPFLACNYTKVMSRVDTSLIVPFVSWGPKALSFLSNQNKVKKQ